MKQRKSQMWLVLSGLLVLFVFFNALIGFLTNSPSLLARNGVQFEAFVSFLGFAKAIVAVLIFFVFSKLENASLRLTALLVAITGLSILAIGHLHAYAYLILAFVVFEFGLNILSPTLLSRMAALFPVETRRMLSGAMMAGIVTGPVVFGYFVDFGLYTTFMVVGIVGAMLPLLWIIRNDPRSGEQFVQHAQLTDLDHTSNDIRFRAQL